MGWYTIKENRSGWKYTNHQKPGRVKRKSRDAELWLDRRNWRPSMTALRQSIIDEVDRLPGRTGDLCTSDYQEESIVCMRIHL